jgi:hypothetical protein
MSHLTTWWCWAHIVEHLRRAGVMSETLPSQGDYLFGIQDPAMYFRYARQEFIEWGNCKCPDPCRQHPPIPNPQFHFGGNI